MNLSKLLTFLSALNQDGKTSITNLVVMVTVSVNAVEPNPYSITALALALLNYNAKRFAVLHYGKREEGMKQRVEKLEAEMKLISASDEMRKISL